MAAAEQVVADEVENEPELSLREQIEAARDEVIDRQVESGEVEVTDSQRTRDASGRFTRGERDTDQTGAPDTSGNQPGSTPAKRASGTDQGPAATAGGRGSPDAQLSGGSAQASGSQPGVAEPPQSWNATEKAVWSKLPPEAQQVIRRREQDFHRRITEDGEVRSVGNQFMSVANEHAALINQRGGNPVGLWREYLGILNRIHSSDPVSRAQLFRHLAMQNGVNLEQPTQQGQAAPPNRQSQIPLEHLVAQAVDQRLTARQQYEAQQQQAQEMQAATAEVERFRSDPQHAHFETVTGLMTGLLNSGAAQTLEEAYQLAVKAHPETSRLIAQQAQEAARAQETAQRKAAAAKRKTGSLRPGAGDTRPAAPGSKGTVRDDIRAAMEEVRGRI